MTASMDIIEIMALQNEYKKIHARMTCKPLPSEEHQQWLQRREEEIKIQLKALGGFT